MRLTRLIHSRRKLWFGIPFLCLSFVLYGQLFRLEFWTQRRDRHAEALEFSGSEIDVKLVEQITPTTIRLMFFVPPKRRVEVVPMINNSNSREQLPTVPRQIETLGEPGLTQITYSFYSDYEGGPGLLYGSWLEISGATITPKSERYALRVVDRAVGWKVDPAVSRGLVATSDGELFLPIFENGSGQRIELRVADESGSQ